MSRMLPILLVLATLSGGTPLAAPPTADSTERVYYHVPRLASARTVLVAAEAHVKEPGARTIALVFHGGGVRAMLKGAVDDKGEPFEPRLRRLAALGLDLVVCGNSLDELKIARSRVLPVGRQVQSGSEEMTRLRGIGYREM